MRIVLDSDLKRAMAKRAIDAAGKGMEVIIRRHSPDDRVDPMRRYLFGVVYPTITERILETHGHVFGVEDIHKEMMRKFLAPLIRRNKDGIEEAVWSLDSLDNEGMGKYVEKVVWYAADRLGCTIPPKKDED